MTEIQFQIIDILSDDIPNDKNDNTFIITLYGINQNNERIVCHVTKFLPYFFIKIPNDWEQPTGVKLIRDILEIKPGNDIEGTLFESVKGAQIQICKDFYGLHWNNNSNNVQQFQYLKISMQTHDSMKKLIHKIKNHYNLKSQEKENLSTKAKSRLDQWRNVIKTSDCDSNLY